MVFPDINNIPIYFFIKSKKYIYNLTNLYPTARQRYSPYPFTHLPMLPSLANS